MSAKTHMKSPWTCQASPPSKVAPLQVCIDSRRGVVALVVGQTIYGQRYDERVVMANARLIAAAPELLAACKYVAARTDGALSAAEADALGKRCLAAIAKAKGDAA